MFLYTKSLKSKDIDLVIDYDELSKLKNLFDVNKNDRLKKYEVKNEEIDIDIYVSFYSDPGIPAEELDKFTDTVSGFKVPRKEILIALKIKAYDSRKGSVKGRKDMIDIVSLFRLADFDWKTFVSIILKYKLSKELTLFKKDLADTFELKEINLNIHKMAKIKKLIIARLGE